MSKQQKKGKQINPTSSLSLGGPVVRQCLHYRSPPRRFQELRLQRPTMVLPRPLAVTLLLPPSLILLVFRFSSSQDLSSESSKEQFLCTPREHPTVAFAGESHSPHGPSLRSWRTEELR